MSVLNRSSLQDSPLADLHELAGEFGLEGFRRQRKDDLIAAILKSQGIEDEGPPPNEEADNDDTGSDRSERRSRRSRGGRGRGDRNGDRDRNQSRHLEGPPAPA